MVHITKGLNVSICEKILKNRDFDELSNFIYDTLKECMDSQIFIVNSIVSTLKSNDLLYKKNYTKGFHYEHDNNMFSRERPFDFVGGKCSIFFLDNCEGYMQVSYFHKEDIEYVNYIHGMRQIVFIYEN